jgi:hypothetical protein
MSQEILAHTKNILKIIADNYDLDYDDMFNLVNLEMNFGTKRINKDDSNFDDTKCYAFVKNKNGICRCNRGKTSENFCKTHYSQMQTGKLQYGCVQTQKTVVPVQKIQMNDADYLYDNISKKVYSMPKNNSQPVLVGKLENK